MPRGRPKSSVKMTKETVRFEEELWLRFSLLYLDPVTKKPKHGKRQEVLNELLREHVNKEERRLRNG